MKHNILVKFKSDVNKTEELYKKIEVLFKNCESIEGVKQVLIRKNCIDRANRYDLLIQLEMTKQALPLYDDSVWHHKWKEEYQDLIEAKAIFDFEE